MKRILLGLALAAASCMAIADDKVNETAKADFAAYCASCHGIARERFQRCQSICALTTRPFIVKLRYDQAANPLP